MINDHHSPARHPKLPNHLAEPASIYDAMHTVLDIIEAAGERAGAPGREREDIPGHVRRMVYQRDNHTCLWCGSRERTTWLYGENCNCPEGRTTHRHGIEEIPNLELDHVIPHSAGGCDHAHNLRVLCHACNSRRSNLLSDSHRAMLPVTSMCTPCRRTPIRSVYGYEDDYDDYDDYDDSTHEYYREHVEEYDQVGLILPSQRFAAFCGTCRAVSWTDDEGSVW
jgi:5-methylcytosine-specific restriction endonuclease McrA